MTKKLSKSKKKLPEWIGKVLLIIALFLVSQIVITPIILSITMKDSPETVYYGKLAVIVGLGGGFFIMIILVVLGNTIGFAETKVEPLCLPMNQIVYEELHRLICDCLQQRAYQYIGESESVKLSVQVYLKRQSGSFNYACSIIVPHDFEEEGEEENEDELASAVDESLNSFFETPEHKSLMTKPLGMVILIISKTRSEELRLLLSSNSAQDMTKSTVCAAVVKDEKKCYVANQKDVFAIQRYKKVQKEAVAILSQSGISGLS